VWTFNNQLRAKVTLGTESNQTQAIIDSFVSNQRLKNHHASDSEADNEDVTHEHGLSDLLG
jgi:hypothetical protein